MAANVYKFPDINALEHHLNGGVRGGPRKDAYDLLGKTLVFTEPTAFTVTFTAGSLPQGLLTFNEMRGQINTQSSNNVLAWSLNGVLALRQRVPAAGGGIAITGASTALVELGFGAGAAVTGLVYAMPDGATAMTAPYYVSSYAAGVDHILIVQE